MTGFDPPAADGDASVSSFSATTFRRWGLSFSTWDHANAKRPDPIIRQFARRGRRAEDLGRPARHNTAVSTARGSATPRFTTDGRRNAPTMRGGATGTSLSLWSIFMNSFLSTLLGWVGLAPPRIFCRRKVWNAGVTGAGAPNAWREARERRLLLGETLTNGDT